MVKLEDRRKVRKLCRAPTKVESELKNKGQIDLQIVNLFKGLATRRGDFSIKGRKKKGALGS